jgi:hypothetical protein
MKGSAINTSERALKVTLIANLLVLNTVKQSFAAGRARLQRRVRERSALRAVAVTRLVSLRQFGRWHEAYFLSPAANAFGDSVARDALAFMKGKSVAIPPHNLQTNAFQGTHLLLQNKIVGLWLSRVQSSRRI